MDHSAVPGTIPEQHIEITFAGFWTRLFGYVIDTVFLWLVGVIVALSAGIIGNLDNLMILNLVSWAIALISPVYCIAFWALYGATPGKIMLGMRIVGPDGASQGIGWWRAMLRFVGYIVSSIFFYLGFIWIAIDRDSQGWHDKIARTRVVNV